MRYALWILIGVVAGFLMGGIKPRQENADLQRELARMADELVVAQKKARRVGRRSWVPVPGLEELFQDEDQEPTADASESDDLSPELEIVQDKPDTGDDIIPSSKSEDLGAEFDAAVDAQRLRARQSRAALVEQADLDDDQIAAFDAAIDLMNDELADLADELGEIPDFEEMAPSEFLGLSHDVTGVLYDGQLSLEEVVGLDALDFVDETTTQIWNYIDLESLRGVAESKFE